MDRFADGQPSGIMIHHSLTRDGLLCDTDAIRRYHVGTNGWDDIGYHAIVEAVHRDVYVLPGRPVEFQGAHCRAVNATHLGLCIVGNFDVEVPSQALLDMAIWKCLSWMDLYPHIGRRDVLFHNQRDPKTCPGRKFPMTGFLLKLDDEIEKRKFQSNKLWLAHKGLS